MDLRQISTLIAIADHGSFSAAARALFTVQSRRIQRELDDIAADISALDDVIAGETRVGVIGTTGRWLMPQFLDRLHAAHPYVRPIVSEGGTSNLLPRLVSGQLDAVIVHLPVDDPELQVEPLFAEDLVLIVNSKHPWFAHDSLPMSALGEHPIILPPRTAVLRRIINRAAEMSGTSLEVQAEIDGVRLMASLAFDGFGPAIVPATAMPRWLTGDFKRITVPELPRRVVGWVQRKRPRPGPPTFAALEITRALVAARGARQPGVHVGPEAFPLKAT